MATVKVLLVEDQSSWQNILRTGISQALHGQVDTLRIVEKFEQAWEALERDGPWHLLITDIGLSRPVLRDKLGKQLVERAHNLHVPCIVVSGMPGLTTQDVRDLLIEYRAHDFFSKDEFDSRRFVTRVQEVLQMAVAAPPESTAEPVVQVPDGNDAESSRLAARGATPSRTKLRNVIVNRFSLEELRTFCSDLGVDYDDLAGTGKEAKARELIEYFQRRDDLGSLVSAIRRERGNII